MTRSHILLKLLKNSRHAVHKAGAFRFSRFEVKYCCDHALASAQLHLWQGYANAFSHLLGGIYNALCNDIALHDAAKDVDQ